MVQKKTSKNYPAEFRARAVRLVVDHRSDYGSDNAAFIAISGKLGCSPDSCQRRCKNQPGGGAKVGHF